MYSIDISNEYLHHFDTISNFDESKEIAHSQNIRYLFERPIGSSTISQAGMGGSGRIGIVIVEGIKPLEE